MGAGADSVGVQRPVDVEQLADHLSPCSTVPVRRRCWLGTAQPRRCAVVLAYKQQRATQAIGVGLPADAGLAGSHPHRLWHALRPVSHGRHGRPPDVRQLLCSCVVAELGQVLIEGVAAEQDRKNSVGVVRGAWTDCEGGV